MNYWCSTSSGMVAIHVFIKYMIKPIPDSQSEDLFPVAAPAAPWLEDTRYIQNYLNIQLRDYFQKCVKG